MKWIAPVIIIILAFVSAYQSIDVGFISDDFVLLHTSQTVSIPRLFTANWLGQVSSGGFYRPITTLVWKLDYWCNGVNPSGYHKTNIIIHSMVSLLVFLYIRLVSEDDWIAFISASLFSVHPVHVEATTWISGRTDLIASLFFLSSLFILGHAYKYKLRPGFSIFISLGLGLFSMLSKEIAFTLPFIVCLTLMNIHREVTWRFPIKRTIVLFFLTLTTVLILRKLFLGNFVAGYGTDTHFRIGGFIFTYLFQYLEWFLIPFRIGIESGTLSWTITVISLILLLLGAFLSRHTRLGISWLIITSLPILNLCRQQYIYLPSLGFFWILGVLIRPGIKTARPITAKTIIQWFVLVSMIGIYTVRSSECIDMWRETGKLGIWIEETFKANYPSINQKKRIVFIKPSGSPYRIEIFQNGLTEALQLWYKNPELSAVRKFSFQTFNDYRKGDDIVLEVKNNRIWNLTDIYETISDFIPLPAKQQSMAISSKTPTAEVSNLDVSCRGLRIYSSLANSVWLPNNASVAELSVFFTDDSVESFVIICGKDTSEWAISRKDVRPEVAHDIAPIIYSSYREDADEIPFPDNTFWSDYVWYEEHQIKAIKCRCLMPESGPNGEIPVLEIKQILVDVGGTR
ncbi:hypothetical protein JW979_11905 [bacterium]|nr:hypothetical protein [candidate division CSSED10-310 bacterium]